MKSDVEQLRKTLLHSHYEAAQDIRIACKEEGYSLPVSFAIAYRSGVIAGKKDVHALHAQLQAERNRANEMTEAYERMLDLNRRLVESASDAEMIDAIQQIKEAARNKRMFNIMPDDPNDPQPTPGDENMEGNNNE